jgi:hypothetical protein
MFVEPSRSVLLKTGQCPGSAAGERIGQDDFLAKAKAFLRLSSRVLATLSVAFFAAGVYLLQEWWKEFPNEEISALGAVV